MKYDYNPEYAFCVIKDHWINWSESTGIGKFVIGVSGGKDSTVAVALACRIFGKDNVVGVSLPCNGQKDMSDVDKVFETYDIQRLTIDIGDAYDSIMNGIENNCVHTTLDTATNLPARLRMSVIYAVAQSVGGTMVNTCNLSEDICGYSTLYGDSAGSYAPIKNLTVTEIIKLGEWLGVPDDLIHKVPIDGLQPYTDEEKLGMKYADIDRFVREGIGSVEFAGKVIDKYQANKFKTDIIRIPGPDFDYPNFTK